MPKLIKKPAVIGTTNKSNFNSRRVTSPPAPIKNAPNYLLKSSKNLLKNDSVKSTIKKKNEILAVRQKYRDYIKIEDEQKLEEDKERRKSTNTNNAKY